jgi:23S rRNA pseudouridine1911/1915/1917 synthase
MDIPILYEDEQIVVIDKPSGVVCNRAETVKSETLQDWMVASGRVAESSDPYFRERSGLVHRLDKETSGVMVLAKTPESFVELLRQFKERQVSKEYIALTHGIWKTQAGEISLPIARRRDNRQLMGVREDGRESITGYRVVDEYKVWQFPKELKVDDRGYIGFSLVAFLPKTGRMHQIRVHSKQLGHPLVGDADYAGRKRSREDRKWAPRVMLQAQTIEFTHPQTKERVKFVSKNREFQEIVDRVAG